MHSDQADSETPGSKFQRIILGTYSCGSSELEEWILNEEEAFPLLEHAYNKGINTWDMVRTLVATEVAL